MMLPKDTNENAIKIIEKPEHSGDSTPNSQAYTTQLPRPKNSKLYYVVASIYCLFLLINGAIIALAPLSWMESPELGSAIKYIAGKMPGMIHLAGKSTNPAEVILGYSFAMLSVPIHLFMIPILFIIRYKTGFVTHKDIMFGVKWAWFLPLLMWVYLGTCLFCNQEPGWRAFALIETRVLIAIFSQFIAMLPAAYPTALLIYLLDVSTKRQQLSNSGANGHVK